MPVIAYQSVAGLAFVARKKGDQFVRGTAFVKRRDERLNDADGTVIGSCIAPGFKVVRGWAVPLAKLGSFVVVQAGMDAHFRFDDRVGKVEIGRRVVRGVRTEDKQTFDFSRIQIVQQIAQRFRLVDGICFYRVGIDHRFSDIA